MNEVVLSLGLMSGTSMDGIDAALIRTDGHAFVEEIASSSLTYDSPFHYALKAAEYAVRTLKGNLVQAGIDYETLAQNYFRSELKLSDTQMNTIKTDIQQYFHLSISQFPTLTQVIDHSTDLHAQLVNQLVQQERLDPSIIGYHGQNLYHAPRDRLTIQVGNAQRLADLTSIPVVNEFRKNDIEHGGQGAPFAPLYHQALAIRDGRIPLAMVNCGGISNLTLIFGPGLDDVMGFDTGPGNGLVDLCIKQQTQGQETFDLDGKYGLRGRVNELALQALFNSLQSYLAKLPPKSLDIGDFSLVPELEMLSIHDAARTLESFTAHTILDSLKFVPREKSLPQTWILAGGGWNNPVIYDEFSMHLKETVPEARIHFAHEMGLDSQALEAQIFAYLAVRSIKQLPLSVPHTTGVPEPMLGGVLTQPIVKQSKANS